MARENCCRGLTVTLTLKLYFKKLTHFQTSRAIMQGFMQEQITPITIYTSTFLMSIDESLFILGYKEIAAAKTLC